MSLSRKQQCALPVLGLILNAEPIPTEMLNELKNPKIKLTVYDCDLLLNVVRDVREGLKEKGELNNDNLEVLTVMKEQIKNLKQAVDSRLSRWARCFSYCYGDDEIYDVYCSLTKHEDNEDELSFDHN